MSDIRLLAAELALRLAGAPDGELDDVVTDALATLAGLADVERAYVTLLRDDGTFENSHEWTQPHVVPHRPAIQRLRTEQFPFSVELAHADRVFDAPDVRDLPDAARAERESFSSFGVRAVLQVPIRIDDRAVGVLGFNRARPVLEWSSELVDTTRYVGQAIGVALVRQRAAAEIRTAWAEADRANQAKQALLADVSHELRTPLHALLGYAELLQLDDRSEPEQLALLEIQRNGRRLLTLVEDLIDMAAGRRAGADATPAAPIVRETVGALAPAGALRGIDFVIGEHLDRLTFDVEPGRLRQVVHCVLSGGLHTLAGGGVITVDGEDEPDRRAGPRLVATLSSDRPFEATAAVTPLARALIDGFGTIETDSPTRSADGHTSRVVIGFGTAQGASP